MYGYVGGNPVMHIDPAGQAAFAIAVSIIASTSALALIIAGASRLYYDGYDSQGGWPACNPGRNDDYKHCVTSCRAARYSLNPLATLGVGMIGETFDLGAAVLFSVIPALKAMSFEPIRNAYLKERKEALKDMLSNFNGLSCALTSPWSCSDCCRSRGYDPDAQCSP